jgi:hypothetical protein
MSPKSPIQQSIERMFGGKLDSFPLTSGKIPVSQPDKSC